VNARRLAVATSVAVLVPLLLLSAVGMSPRAVQPQIAPSLPPDPEQASQALANDPLMFIENVGQFAEGARFLVHGGDRTIWLAQDALWVTVLEPGSEGAEEQGGEGAEEQEGEGAEVRSPARLHAAASQPKKAVHVRLSFPGAEPHPRLEPFDRLDTHVSYFIGGDPAGWRADVPVWGGVRYVGLYPGIDLEIASQDGRLAPRLVVRDGEGAAQLASVRLRVEGAGVLALDGDRLRLGTPLGDFTLPLFQVDGALDANRFSPALTGDQIAWPFAASTDVAPSAIHDPRSPADNPADLLYATFLGGSSVDWGIDIAVDGSGNAYVTGRTESPDFPAAVGPGYDTSHNGIPDAFVVKLNPTGTGLAYATFLGGYFDDYGYGIAADGSGNAYVTGYTSSSDFPAAGGPGYDTGLNGDYDAFVVKLNPAGTSLTYATFLGGSSIDYGHSIAVDGPGNAYVTGHTWSANFPAAGGPGYDTSHNGYYDAFVVKLNPGGTGLAYATFLGGSDYDSGTGIAVDGSGHAYVTGNTESSNFPAAGGPGYDISYNGGDYDAFVVKLNPGGTGLAYATFLGGRSSDHSSDTAVDGSGNIYVTGNTDSPNFPAAGGPGYDTSYNGDYDAFVVKLNPAGTGLAYATFLGGSAGDGGGGIAVDGSGSAYVTGYTYSSNFPAAGGPGYDTSHNGENDAFVVRLNASGTGLAYATFLGGSLEDDGVGIAVDSSGHAYVTGDTGSSNFPAAGGPGYDTSHNGYYDAFVVKLAVGGGPGPTPHGSLTLLVGAAIPTSRPLAATAQVRNTGTVPQTFTLTTHLWQAGTTLSTQIFTLSLAAGAAANRTADFGLRPAGRYRVEGVLSAGGATLAVQGRDVLVTSPAASRIIHYANGLRMAAHAELDDMAWLSSWALSDEVVSLGLDKIEDYAVGKFADLAAPIQDAGGIPRSTSNDAIAQIQDKLGRTRQYQRNLATAIRLFVRGDYKVTLPAGFDPLNPDLDFITDPILKDRIKNTIAGYLANFIRDRLVSPWWVNGPRSNVDGRHVAFENFVTSHAVVGEPPGLAGQTQHGRDRILNVVEGDAIVTVGPCDVLGHTLRYDLTLQEQENKRQWMDRVEFWVKLIIFVGIVIGAVITILLVLGAISSVAPLALAVVPWVWKIVKVAVIITRILPYAKALLVVLMLFTVTVIAPHVPQYHDETLDAAEALIGSSGLAYMRSFDVTVQPGQARLTTRVDGPETGESRVLVETALYSVDGRIISLIWSPLQVQAGQQGTLSKEVPLAPGAYRAVTTLYAEGDVAAAEATRFDVPGPEVELALSLSQPRLSPGQPVQAHVTLTNTSPISDVNDLTLIVESTDGVNFDAWPVSLVTGGARQIDYTFTPTTTGAYVLRAWLGIGLSTLAQEDVAYIVGSGPAIAFNTRLSDVYTAGLTVTLPLTLTNVGDAPGVVTVTVQTMDRLQTGVTVFSSTLTATVPVSGTTFAQATALPNAQPGLYSAWLDVNGAPYDAHDFAVSAADTLFGLLAPGNMYPAVGQSVPVTATVRSADSTLTDAIITVTVQSPTSGTMALAMTRITTGTYRANYTPAVSGTYPLELAVTRANYRSVGDRAFLVAGTPTLLIPTVEGQPQAGEIRIITVTVRSEAGGAIPGATVVLSGTEEILRGETDATGRVVLQTFPPDARSYVLTTDKMGCAGATTEVAVGWLRVCLPLVLRNR